MTSKTALQTRLAHWRQSQRHVGRSMLEVYRADLPSACFRWSGRCVTRVVLPAGNFVVAPILMLPLNRVLERHAALRLPACFIVTVGHLAGTAHLWAPCLPPLSFSSSLFFARACARACVHVCACVCTCVRVHVCASLSSPPHRSMMRRVGARHRMERSCLKPAPTLHVRSPFYVGAVRAFALAACGFRSVAACQLGPVPTKRQA